VTETTTFLVISVRLNGAQDSSLSTNSDNLVTIRLFYYLNELLTDYSLNIKNSMILF